MQSHAKAAFLRSPPISLPARWSGTSATHRRPLLSFVGNTPLNRAVASSCVRGTIRNNQGTPVYPTELSAHKVMTGTAVRPETCKTRWEAAPSGGAISPAAPSSATNRAASTASAPHCPTRPRMLTRTGPLLLWLACSSASKMPSRTLCNCGSSGGSNTPIFKASLPEAVTLSGNPANTKSRATAANTWRPRHTFAQRKLSSLLYRRLSSRQAWNWYRREETHKSNQGGASAE